MEIKAQVHNIVKLKDYFFIVPDYQREYVWKVDDQVEQFLVDIDNEFEPGAKQQSSYFIGSIIVVKNDKKYDVIDGLNAAHSPFAAASDPLAHTL